ncbi:hypothetical protein CEXT_419441 [Caerostris extrusa]|uniref:Uncharacterized protein n=1 Tax=Caerostris extrusa TaxID=172846 RepID=A0AAV4N868_CAEEX|nr:hypothetical protein CEXT_419441 [Caerostris extrusa]
MPFSIKRFTMHRSTSLPGGRSSEGKKISLTELPNSSRSSRRPTSPSPPPPLPPHPPPHSSSCSSSSNRCNNSSCCPTAAPWTCLS